MILRKMRTEFTSPVNYFIEDSDTSIEISNFVGKEIEIIFQHQINCIKCGKQINKTFGQGFCYACFVSAPEAEACVLHPEKCTAHEGVARDMEYAKESCLKAHYVYLSKTSNIKVGVTRQSQIPTRWIDQGATEAIKLAKTPYRQLAGAIEVELKKNFADKTQWQKMLKNIFQDDSSLPEAKKRAIELLPAEFCKFVINDNRIYNIEFPVLGNPTKIKSVKLDKISSIKGILTGIKGQYLIFDNQNVINIRSHSGYNVDMRI